MAIYEQDVVMFETKENGDKVIKMPISRANNIEGIGRSANTAYVVDDVVYVDNNKKVALKCTQAGTTSNSELNVSTANIGNVITDGTVKWQVCNRTSDVTSVNGNTGDVVVGEVTNLSISGRTITVTFADSTTKTLTTQDTAPFTARATAIGGASTTKPAVVVETYRSGTTWYRKWSDGWLEQGGFSNTAAANYTTITFPNAFADTNYFLIGASTGGGNYVGSQNRTTTSAGIATHSSGGAQKQQYAWYACGKGA